MQLKVPRTGLKAVQRYVEFRAVLQRHTYCTKKNASVSPDKTKPSRHFLRLSLTNAETLSRAVQWAASVAHGRCH